MYRSLSLPKAVAAVAAVVMIIAAGVFGFVGWSRWTAQIIDLGESYHANLSANLLNAVRGAELEPFLSEARLLDSDSLRTDERVDRLRRTVLAVTRGSRIAKIKIYSPEGMTIFSTDSSQIGARKEEYDRFVQAIQGHVVSEIEYGEAYVDLGGRVAQADLLSSYLSIRSGDGDGEIYGVFELYTDVTDFKHEAIRTEIYGLAILLGGLGAIYGLLLAAVVAGSHAIARQHQDNLALASAAARAKAASRAKSKFLANMSHELRTPLNAIIGFSEIISTETLGPVTPGRYRSYAEDINPSGQHLLAIIDDVLDMAKV